MKTGDWRACKNFIVNEKMNAKVWELFHKPDTVRDMMTRKIQEESLRTYLFTYRLVLDVFSQKFLMEMTQLCCAMSQVCYAISWVLRNFLGVLCNYLGVLQNVHSVLLMSWM